VVNTVTILPDRDSLIPTTPVDTSLQISFYVLVADRCRRAWTTNEQTPVGIDDPDHARARGTDLVVSGCT